MILWIEVKPDDVLEKLAKKQPNRYVKDLDRQWRCPPGEQTAARYGFRYLVWSSAMTNVTLVRNLRFLDDYNRSRGNSGFDAHDEKFMAAVRSRPGIELGELLRQYGQGAIDAIFTMIANRRLYADLGRFALHEGGAIPLYCDKAAADALASMQTELEATRTGETAVRETQTISSRAFEVIACAKPVDLETATKRVRVIQDQEAATVPERTLRRWRAEFEKQVPSLSSLFRISAVFQVPVLDWLVKSIDTTPRSFFDVRAAAPKRLLRRCDLSIVRTKLETLISAEHEFPPRAFAEICRSLGTEQSFAARKFPDYARILIERRKQYLSIKKQMGRQFTKLAVESTFTRLLSDGVRPTSTQMAKSLPKGIALRDRGARDEFNRLRRELAVEFNAIQTSIAAPAAPATPIGKNKVAAAVLDP